MWWMIAIGLVAFAVIAYIAGSLIAETHVATVTRDYSAKPEQIYEAISDPNKYMEWRSGLKKVEVNGDQVSEHGSFGVMTYRITDKAAGRRMATTEAGGPDLGFSGSWTFQIEPAGTGSRLSITERGRVFSPLFRLMARFVFGYERTMIQYHTDLAKRLETGG